MFLSNPPADQNFSEDGFDLQWATNVLGPFHFTQLLMPALIAGAESSKDKKARVTFTASIVQSKSIVWNSFTDTPARKKQCADQRYMQSKFVRIESYIRLVNTELSFSKANTVIARELARRCGDKGIVSVAINPGRHLFRLCSPWFYSVHLSGNIRSDLQRQLPGFFRKPLVSAIINSAVLED